MSGARDARVPPKLGEVRHLVSFWDWVRGAGKGSRFAYHVGSSETGPTAVKGAAYEAYRAGLVTLVQVNVSSAEDGHGDTAIRRCGRLRAGSTRSTSWRPDIR